MPKTRPPYSPEFRRQMVELVGAGRSPEDLSREFEPTAQSISTWVAQADKQAGRREEKVDGRAAAERDELARLRATERSRSLALVDPMERHQPHVGRRHRHCLAVRFRAHAEQRTWCWEVHRARQR